MSKRKTPFGPLRELLWERAGGRCEAVFEHGNRCRNSADEAHHALPRRQGGTVLDTVAVQALADGTFVPGRHLAHLLALCHVCHHSVAHGTPERAARLRLRILGAASYERWSGLVAYIGPDEQLGALWPQEVTAGPDG